MHSSLLLTATLLLMTTPALHAASQQPQWGAPPQQQQQPQWGAPPPQQQQQQQWVAQPQGAQPVVAQPAPGVQQPIQKTGPIKGLWNKFIGGSAPAPQASQAQASQQQGPPAFQQQGPPPSQLPPPVQQHVYAPPSQLPPPVQQQAAPVQQQVAPVQQVAPQNNQASFGQDGVYHYVVNGGAGAAKPTFTLKSSGASHDGYTVTIAGAKTDVNINAIAAQGAPPMTYGTIVMPGGAIYNIVHVTGQNVINVFKSSKSPGGAGGGFTFTLHSANGRPEIVPGRYAQGAPIPQSVAAVAVIQNDKLEAAPTADAHLMLNMYVLYHTLHGSSLI